MSESVYSKDKIAKKYGVPVVLLFGNDYHLFPVIDKGAIQGYSWMNNKLQ
jgi:hypothetical protein